MEFVAAELRIQEEKVEGRQKLPMTMAMASLVNESSFLRVFKLHPSGFNSTASSGS